MPASARLRQSAASARRPPSGAGARRSAGPGSRQVGLTARVPPCLCSQAVRVVVARAARERGGVDRERVAQAWSERFANQRPRVNRPLGLAQTLLQCAHRLLGALFGHPSALRRPLPPRRAGPERELNDRVTSPLPLTRDQRAEDALVESARLPGRRRDLNGRGTRRLHAGGSYAPARLRSSCGGAHNAQLEANASRGPRAFRPLSGFGRFPARTASRRVRNLACRSCVSSLLAAPSPTAAVFQQHCRWRCGC